MYLYTMLLPSNDVLQHRKYDTTLMSCFLFDPSLKAAAIICLSRALSVSASMCVNRRLLGEISTGCLKGQKSGVLYTLFRYAERSPSPSINLEALQVQALRSLSHNYPNVTTLCWEQISSIIYGVLSSFPDESSRQWKGNVEQSAAQIKERVATAAVKIFKNAC